MILTFNRSGVVGTVVGAGLAVTSVLGGPVFGLDLGVKYLWLRMEIDEDFFYPLARFHGGKLTVADITAFQQKLLGRTR